MKKQVTRSLFTLMACVCVLFLSGCDSDENGAEVSNNTGTLGITEVVDKVEQTEDSIYIEETLGNYTVTFVDYDGTVLSEVVVAHGENAPVPENPVRDKYVFAGWDGAYQNVTEDTTVTATYAGSDSPNVVCMEHSAIENGSVTVTVRMMGEVRFCTFQTLLDYDESALQFIEMNKYNGVEGRNVDLNGDLMVTMAWAGFDNITNDLMENDGVLVEIVFNILNPDCDNTTLSFVKDQTYMNTVSEDGSYADAEYTLMDCVLKMN